MQSNHSTNYSVLCLMHMVEQLIIPHSLILSKVGFQLFVSFSLLSQLSSVCPTVLGSVSAVCPSLQWLTVLLSISCCPTMSSVYHTIHPSFLSYCLLSCLPLSAVCATIVVSYLNVSPTTLVSYFTVSPNTLVSYLTVSPNTLVSYLTTSTV